MGMQFFVEENFQCNVTPILEENSETKSKKLYLQSNPTLVAEQINGNKNFYYFDAMKKGVDKYREEFLKSGRAIGQLDHPTKDMGVCKLKDASHRFTEITEDSVNKTFNTKALIFESEDGLKIKNFIENGLQIGISSRGYGKSQRKKDINYIGEIEYVTVGDFVWNPSAPGAFSHAISENQEWIFENGLYVGKDLNQKIDIYKEALNKSSTKDRSSINKSIFMDHIRDIKLSFIKPSIKF